ncbi:MAG: helicase-exonuclease AddAB subunit AddB, partial [Clostridiales bacterium]|nr:helicase-exonuclease AddAB subunit AddB [Clostridiales bacterium]
EVEDTARSIIALCRDKGYRYRDIAVVSRAVENYEKAIEAVFKQYGIPHFLDRKKDIMSNPMVIFILSALEIIKSNWSYQPVFRYIKTGLTCLTRDEADLLENYVLSNGIRGGRWTRPEQWSFKPERSFPGENDEERSGKEAEYLEKINAYRAAVATPLANFHNALKASKKAEDACTALYDLLVANGLLQKVEELSEGFASAGNIAMANEYRQVWEAVMELLDQLVEVAGDLPVDVAGFTALLEAGLGEYGIGLVPASLDQVLVGSVERSKSHEIKALFVIGANDGVFPAAASEEGILSDDERNRLAAAGIELAKDSKSKAYEERLLVYTTLSTPSEELRVSWTASDMESRAMRPSRIISDLKRILPGIDVRSNIAGSRLAIDERELIAAPAPAFNELVAAVRRQQDGKTVNGREADPDVVHKEGNSERQDGTPEYRSEKLWAAAYKWFSGSDDWKAHTARIFSGLGQTGGISPVMRDKALKLYGNPMFSSVSRLETYSACPFSYFVQYGLKAQERNIFSWKPVDVGTFMHAVLEEFSAVLETEGVSWRDLDREWCEKRISMIVDALLEKMTGTVFTSSKRYLWLTSRLKNIITRAALLTAEHFKRSCFEPVSYEADFREGGRFPPITICLPSGETMRLTGRIDRIDKYEDGENTYLRIVDYKSGNKALKLADVYYGLQLQLLTYMDAVLGEMDTGGVLSNGALACGEMDTGGVLANGAPSGGEMDTGSVLPGGVLYFRLDDPIISGDRTLNEADIETA